MEFQDYVTQLRPKRQIVIYKVLKTLYYKSNARPILWWVSPALAQ